MPRYKILVEYAGTELSGWQFQPNQKTIQSVIEKAIFNFTNEQIRIIGAGRTDAGVHAIGQVAHFNLKSIIPCEKIINAINHFTIKNNVVIKECDIVDDNFHARYSATGRQYKYIILNRNVMPTIDKNRVWWINKVLDVSAMKNSIKHLLYINDFSSFRAKSCQAKSPFTSLTRANIVVYEKYIYLYFYGKSFLHHMVRNIVGTLVEVGLGKISSKEFQDIISYRNRKFAGPTAPASGLYLTKVEYEAKN